MLDLIFIGILLLVLWKAKRITGFNPDYLALDVCNHFRGLLALLVVCSHLAQLTHGGTFFHSLMYTGWLLVAGFFFFSGYGVTKKYMSDNTYRTGFLGRRLPTILVPYLLATAVFLAVRPPFPKLWVILGSFVNGHTLLPFSWYILCIAFFYIVFYVFMCCLRQHYKKILAASVLYYFLWIAFCKALHYEAWWFISSSALVMGMFWAVYQPQIEKWVSRFYGRIFAGAVLLMTLVYIIKAWAVHIAGLLHFACTLLFMMTVPCLFVLICLLISLKCKIGNPITAVLGRLSLEIYLVHGISIALCKPLFTQEFLGCASVLVITAILAYLLQKASRFILRFWRPSRAGK